MALKEYTTPIPSKWVTVGGSKRDGTKNPDSVKGYLVAVNTGPNKFDPLKTKTDYVLQTPEGFLGVSGNSNLYHKVKDSMARFQSEHKKSALGAWIVITYVGTKPSSVKGNNPTKLFSVQFDADDMIETIEVPSETTEDASYDNEDKENDEDAQQAVALAAAERAAKVKALLSGNKAKNK